MNHLPEPLLNEYLDAALDAESRRRVEAHLAACSACRSKLADLALVFAALESVPEQALGRDQVPEILRRIPQLHERSPWRLALAAQAAAAIALLVWLGASSSDYLETWLREVYGFLDRGSLFQPLAEAWLSVQAWQVALPRLVKFSFQPGAALWAALVLAGLAFVVGNLLFLRANGKEVRR